MLMTDGGKQHNFTGRELHLPSVCVWCLLCCVVFWCLVKGIRVWQGLSGKCGSLRALCQRRLVQCWDICSAGGWSKCCNFTLFPRSLKPIFWNDAPFFSKLQTQTQIHIAVWKTHIFSFMLRKPTDQLEIERWNIYIYYIVFYLCIFSLVLRKSSHTHPKSLSLSLSLWVCQLEVVSAHFPV